MRSGARALAALLVVGAAASSGLVAVDSAAAVSAPSGRVLDLRRRAPPRLDAPPASDVSTALEPWTTVADGGFSLTSSGATASGGTRRATATITSGPVISATDDVTGTASFLLSVDGVPLADPVQVAFAAEAGDPVTDLVATVDAPGRAPRARTSVRLDAVYFDVPAESLRVACNGQESGSLSPGGPNPATAPLPTDVTTDFTAVASSVGHHHLGRRPGGARRGPPRRRRDGAASPGWPRRRRRPCSCARRRGPARRRHGHHGGRRLGHDELHGAGAGRRSVPAPCGSRTGRPRSPPTSPCSGCRWSPPPRSSTPTRPSSR